MDNFQYRARDKFSRLVSATMAAESRDAAAKKLQDMGYIPISINEVRQPEIAEILGKFTNRVTLEELSEFTRQLYSLQKAGLPLLSSLEALSSQAKNRYFKNIIDEISARIKGGLSFSESLKEHNRVFGEIYVNMIRVAEGGGRIAEILEKLSLLLEQEIDTRSRIKAATRYPLLAFIVLCLGFFIIVTFVIPRFTVVYSQFSVALPLPTRLLIAISVAVRKYWYIFILGLAGAGFIFIRFINSKTGRPLWDGYKLKFPVLGPLISMLIMSRFSRLTAILMKSGVPVLEVLDLTAGAAGNIVIARAILQIKESVSQGKGISEPMRVSNLFPPGVVQMVAVGEQTGRIDELLLSVADYYDRESGYTIKNLTTYIEPLLILVLAIMVLIMALAIFLPMWNLIRVFRPH